MNEIVHILHGIPDPYNIVYSIVSSIRGDEAWTAALMLVDWLGG